jgi:hypothetical protein
VKPSSTHPVTVGKPGSIIVKPIDYMLKRWDRFARFIDDGRNALQSRCIADRAAIVTGRAKPKVRENALARGPSTKNHARQTPLRSWTILIKEINSVVRPEIGFAHRHLRIPHDQDLKSRAPLCACPKLCMR